jgi:hypothetical protein
MFAVPRVKLAGSERGAMPGARVARKIREDERFEVTVCRIAISVVRVSVCINPVGGLVLSRTE